MFSPLPFEFKRYGAKWNSRKLDISPNCKMIDEMAVIRSMTSKVNEHAQGNYAIHTGFPFMGHPICRSMGQAMDLAI
jgi:hypothetical protein